MKRKEFEGRLADFTPALFRFSRKFVQNSDDSDDLVQDTLLRALRYREKFKEDKNLLGWLFIIMRNTFINQYRKGQAAGRTLSLETSRDVVTRQSPLHSDGPVHVHELWDAVDSIDADLGRPLKMHMSGYKYEEIADQLGVPVGTVKSRIFSARQQIRSLLPGYNVLQ